jgi:preprotein translocase subunit SecA
MSNFAALVAGREVQLADGVCCERRDSKELIVDEWLRGQLTRLPQFGLHLRRLRRFAAQVAHLEDSIRPLDDAALVAAFRQNCSRARRAGFTNDIAAYAFACTREASRRVLGMRHHDVQIMAGWALLHGYIAEMQTGEGKTLVATLPACAVAASGAATHVITVNDYLAERDAKSNLPLYEMLGLSVGTVLQGMSPAQRTAEYAKDIVYVSNKEIVFDYLKDRIADGGQTRLQHALRRIYRPEPPPSLILRGLHYAIVDEADSVLIDEARTPLIISATEPDDQNEVFHQALECARSLQRDLHFTLSVRNEPTITAAGERHLAEHLADLPGVWRSSRWRQELCQKALTALYSFHRDEHYLIAEGKVQIVDEFTGRVMPDRSWERGLHQMVEIKEGCELTGQRRTLSQMTYQRFFRRYLLLGGMTGTAQEVRAELNRTYRLRVLTIPTHRRSRRVRLPDRCVAAAHARHEQVARRAADIVATGRAVLIGTRSVEHSERLSAVLASINVDHRVLNARQDGEEAAIVARAGEAAAITVATNMAGRGTDIKLTDAVRERGGLHVILTEFHESARVDRQLFGRCARQGDPGTVEAIISLEDELFVRHASLLRKLALVFCRGNEISRLLARTLVGFAQWNAEARNFRVRMSTLKQDRRLQAMLAFAGKLR